MPWQTPSISDVRRQVRDNLTASLPGANASVPNTVLRVLADANAGVAALNLQYLDWLSRQFLPDTAEHEWLLRHAAIWLGGGKQATFASGAVLVTGLGGTVVPLGTRLSGNGEVEYETTESVTIGTKATPVDVRALTAGAIGNMTAGATLAISVALSGVDGQATVDAIEGGSDAESDDSLRERVLFRIQKPPMGGDADDYVAWARAQPGVSRAWCSPNEMGIGTVTVRIMMDELRSDAAGYPNDDDLTAVREALNLLRPVAVKDFSVERPIPEEVSFTITNLDDDTEATRAAIAASVQAMLADRASPARAVRGVRVPAQTIYREWVSAAILNAAGVESFDLTMVDHVMPTNGSMAVLGSIAYA